MGHTPRAIMEVRVRNDGASEAMAVYFGDSHSYRGYNS